MLRWSINLFRVRGIQLSLHSSFLLLLAYVSWEGWTQAGLLGATTTAVYMLALFACVTLHELGHALAANYFGVRVPRILLMPIGGMAQLDHIPRRPRHEIIIALAGPAVNYLIIGVLMIFVRFPDDWDPNYITLAPMDFARFLVIGNLVLGVFNLLPAFPMDGGRVLRALLAIKFPYLRATQIAVGVSMTIGLTCIAFFAYHAFYLKAVLFMFILFSAWRELQSVKRTDAAERLWATSRTIIVVTPPLVPPVAHPPEEPRPLI